MRLNLVPENIQQRQRRNARIHAWSVALAAAAASLVIPIGWDWSRHADAERLQRQSAELNHSRSLMRAEWESIKNEVRKTHSQIEGADALRAKRAWSAMLALVARDLPPSVWLTSLATDPAQPPGQAAKSAPTAISKAGQNTTSMTIDAPGSIILEGYAPRAEDPIALVSNLKASGVFHSVVLRRCSLEPVDDGSYFRFDIVGEWRP